MKLVNFSGAKSGTKATLTHIDANNKKVHFVIGDAHAEYDFEGEPIEAKLLGKVFIAAGGEVTLAGSDDKAKSAVKQKSGATGNGAAYNKQY